MATHHQSGGARPGAGRPKGSRARRDLEAIAEVRTKFPHWSPLLHLATVANDEMLGIEVRLDAAKAAAPYFHAKLKCLDSRDPETVLAYEQRLAEIRSRAMAREMPLDGLADRLERAHARIDEYEQQNRTDEQNELFRLRAIVARMEKAKHAAEHDEAENAARSPERAPDPDPINGARLKAQDPLLQEKPFLADVEYDLLDD